MSNPITQNPDMTQQPGMAAPKEPRVHLGWLDSLRALAALYVVMNHILVIVNPDLGHYHGLALVAAGPFRYGHSAVGLFIVLSGFSLMIPVTRNDGELRGGSWKFFGRRAKRILPPYYGALGLTLVLIHFLIGQKTGSGWDTAIPVTRFDIWTHVFMLQDVFSFLKISAPMWSISVEWRIYFLFPIFVLLFGRWGGGKAVLGVLAIAFLVTLSFQHYGLSLFYNTMPAYFALFTMGMLACEIGLGHQKQLRELRDKAPWLALWFTAWLVDLGLLFKWRANVSPTHLFLQDAVDGIVAALLLLALSKPGANRLRDALSWKPLVFVGTFAYSIYLIHMPFAQIIWQYGLHPLHKGFLATYFLMIVIGLPLIIGASYLFFLAFERPFLNTKKHETLAETARDAALSPAP